VAAQSRHALPRDEVALTPAPLSQDQLFAPLPANVCIYYFTAKTPEGLMVSSPVVIKK
jgi:hypothetical protein